MAIPQVSTSFERYFIDIQGSFNELDGSSTIVETYHIKKKSATPGPVIAPGQVIAWDATDFQLLVVEGVLPAQGTLYGTWNSNATNCAFPTEYMRCRSVEYQTAKTGDIKAMVTWTTFYSVKPSTIGGTAAVELPASMEWVGATRTMKAWRRTWTINPPLVADTTSDIGGTSYNGKLQGVDVQVQQVKIRIRFTLDASFTPMISQYTKVSGYLGAKNSDVFMNFPIGSLICDGISMVKIQNEYYELIVEMLYDQFMHHEQVPSTDSDGEIELDASGNAKTVFWERVTRASAPFNNLWGGNAVLQDLVEDGYWQ